MKNFSKRKGFTLVELLIVIVVIGVLSAMMMLSSTEAVSSAKASNIISNLRNLKTAVLSWYADNLDKVQADGRVKLTDKLTDKDIKPIQEWTDAQLGISKYFSNGDSVPYKGKNETKGGNGFYCIYDAGSGNRTTWYVGYRFDIKTEAAVKEKVKARKDSLGLIFVDEEPNHGKGDGRVWMKVMGDWEPSTSSN